MPGSHTGTDQAATGVCGYAAETAGTGPIHWREIASFRGRGAVVDTTRLDTRLGRALELCRRYLLKPAGGRTSPSAGALYPFEIWATDAGTGDLGLVDLPRRAVLTAGVRDFAREPEILVVLRPWVSVRKYGPRGLSYALLDVGHALLNLQIGLGLADAAPLTLSTAGLPTRVPFPVGRVPVARIRGVAEQPADRSGAPAWTVEDLGPGGGVAEVAEYEALFGARVDQSWHLPALSLPVLRDATGRLDAPVDHRRSAAAFGAELPADEVRAILSRGQALWRELRGEDRYSAVATATFARSGRPDLFSSGNLAHQQHLTRAGHLIALAIPARSPDSPIDGDVAASIISAGRLGQCIYLAAAEHEVGITGVGGFVPSSFLVSATTWPVYCLALGAPVTAPAVKRDTLATADAHGYGQ